MQTCASNFRQVDLPPHHHTSAAYSKCQARSPKINLPLSICPIQQPYLPRPTFCNLQHLLQMSISHLAYYQSIFNLFTNSSSLLPHQSFNSVLLPPFLLPMPLSFYFLLYMLTNFNFLCITSPVSISIQQCPTSGDSHQASPPMLCPSNSLPFPSPIY